jgi:8-oxo-dGTP pyrophosphatase MutT (NUDIX family)
MVGMTAKPRDAATLILVRDCSGPAVGIEVLLLRRHSRSAFLPDAHVFPGGAVEDSDFAPGMAALCPDLSFERAHRVIKDVSPPERALGFLVAAIREAFEESGILLAYVGRGQRLMEKRQMVRLDRCRMAVHANPSAFASRLGDEEVKLAVDSLFYFAHWITPEVLPIRFDARFFVAIAPRDQEASADGRETVGARWVSPRDALDDHRRGEIKLAPPTFHSLGELAEFRTVDEVLASTQGKVIETHYG